MKPTRQRWTIALSLAAIVLIAVLAYLQSRHPDEQALQTTQTLLDNLSMEESQFREYALRTRYGLDPNYDTVTRLRNAINADLTKLNAINVPLPIKKSITVLNRIEQKEDIQAEDYKSANSVIRNSLRYYLYEVDRLLSLLPDKGHYANLQHKLGGSTIGFLQSTIQGNGLSGQIATDTIDAPQQLQQLAQALPTEQSTVVNLIRHTQILAADIPKLNVLTLSLINSGSMEQIRRINTMTNAALQKSLQQKNIERIILGGAILLLLLTLSLLLKRYLDAVHTSRGQQRFLQSLTDNVGVAVLVSHDDIIRFANPKAAQILGYKVAQLIGLRVHGQLHVYADGTDVNLSDCEIIKTIQQHQRSAGECYFRTHDGRIMPIMLHSSSYQEANGDQQVVMAFQDITERKQTEDKVQQLSLVIEQSPESVVITDLEGDIEYVNQAFLNNTGYSLNEVIGQNSRILKSEKNLKETYAEMWNTLLQEKIWKGELRTRRKDGSEYDEMAIIFSIRSQDNRVRHYVAVKEDITKRKQLEADLGNKIDDLIISQRIYGALLAEADTILNAHTDVMMLQATCDNLVIDTIFDGVFISQFNVQTARHQILAFAGIDATLLEPFDVNNSVFQIPQAMQTSAIIVCNTLDDIAVESPCKELMHHLQRNSFLTATIARNNQTWGVLVFLATKSGAFTDQVIALCQRISGLLGKGLTENDNRIQLQQLQSEEAYRARHDSLTGLSNRFALEQFLPKEIARSRRNQNLLAVGMLDLDRFKPVNDTYGHEAGDALLCELARRFRSLVRETDLVARLGGDEFIVIIENLDEDQVVPQLSQALERLHGAVEHPFEVIPGKFVEIDMTMGLALYPRHGIDGDSLMREADAAMYQAKTSKAQRDSWWQLGTQSQDAPSQEPNMDIFGLDAAEHLRQSQPLLEITLVTFVEAFYHDLAQEPDPAEILAAFSTADRLKLKTHQADHLRFLLNPMTTRAEMMNRGQQVGRVHMLIGVSSIMLVQSYALYRHLLNQHLNLESMTARTRYRLMQLIDERLQTDLQAQLESRAHVTDQYQNITNHDLPLPNALWVDVAKEEFARLGHLPGIVGVILMRLDSRGIFIVEHSAGPKADAISQVLQSPESAIIIDPASPRGQGLCATAWRSNQIQSLASYSANSQNAFLQEGIQSIGLRSAMAIPVTDMSGHVVTLLVFYGAYPHQFETSWMRQFAYGLQKRWGDLWTRTSGQATALVMSQDEAHLLRDRLFAGGLSMFMQPIVDLRNGHAVKVEALARLIMSDGQVILPGEFLSLLGDSELDQVFRQGLDQTLTWLNRWDMAGLNLTVSINLPPSTLLDPECPRWVADALTHHNIAAERLYLELLETGYFNADKQGITIEQLVQQGIKISMDDLGSGYSSLKRLSTLPFDMIKVDQDLLKELYIHPLETLGLITTIINLGRYYRHDVVVEGLEDAGMLEVAAILGAQFGQGYSISRPMPAESIADWMCNTAIVPYAGHIHTLIGALAYQHHIFMDDRQEETDIKTCPVECFLVEHNLQETNAYRWHTESHAGNNESGKLLLDWLVKHVKEAHES